MTSSFTDLIDSKFHPINLLEKIIISKNWVFERPIDDEIYIEVPTKYSPISGSIGGKYTRFSPWRHGFNSRPERFFSFWNFEVYINEYWNLKFLKLRYYFNNLLYNSFIYYFNSF